MLNKAAVRYLSIPSEENGVPSPTGDRGKT